MASLRSTTSGTHGRRGRRTMAEINMVPFIDVMLVLLIIFMVTAPLITPSMIDLPSVGKASQQPNQVVQVIIGANETLKVKANDTNEQAVSQDQLAKEVRALLKSPQDAVVISADKSVRYETVVRVMDRLQQAGLARIGLSVQLAP